MMIRSRSLGALPSFILCALCVPLLLACHESGSGDYFGHWDDSDGGAVDGGVTPRDGGVTPDGSALTCAQAFTHAKSTPRFDRWAPDDDDDDDDDKYIKPDPKCLSGYRWIGDDDEDSPLMMPGSDCISCHRPEIDDDDAPVFALAGTVYGALHEPDDCLGLQGATVRITDAMGKRTDFVSNRAGNFYVKAKSARFALPFTAELVYQGRTRKMMGARCETSCNTCHTAAGDNGAPGRILAP